jgi:thiol-disulfide isomerase/thioredoxin
MISIGKLIILTFVLFFYVGGLTGQNYFHVRIIFPLGIDLKTVKVAYDDGISQIEVPDSSLSYDFRLNGQSHSPYSTITISHFQSSTYGYVHEYFVQADSALIRFDDQRYILSGRRLDSAALTNAIEVNQTESAKRFESFVEVASSERKTFLEKYHGQINTNDSLLNIYRSKTFNVDLQSLDYVTKFAGEYYSFWYFRRRLLPSLADTLPEQLYKTFHSVFSQDFINSVEGQHIDLALRGVLFTKKGYSAPRFVTHDFQNKNIDLKEYKGKFVLLNFWASWCVPCLEEVPFINNLQKQYSADQLEIIGVSYDSDKKAFLAAIATHRMKWVHIFRDELLIKAYGNKPIPTTYLIDPEGKIIFSSWEDNSDQLTLLLEERLNRQRRRQTH